jgi:hypothetical protein
MNIVAMFVDVGKKNNEFRLEWMLISEDSFQYVV